MSSRQHKVATVAVVGCMLACGPGGGFAPRFHSHRSKFEELARSLKSIRGSDGIDRFYVMEGAVHLGSNTGPEFTLEEAMATVSSGARPVVARIGELAPGLVYNCAIEENDVFLCLTWSAGAPAGGGYAMPGPRGAEALDEIKWVDSYRVISDDGVWYEWGT